MEVAYFSLGVVLQVYLIHLEPRLAQHGMLQLDADYRGLANFGVRPASASVPSADRKVAIPPALG